ncbi:BatD family protein [Halochromatium salexigens]|uniref:BatD family protein n=1 Tax=Halochromatium salexigens TaxID=49447 RepID=UPI001914AAE0|nr:BatD family protein [Halochromatium salexigens]
MVILLLAPLLLIALGADASETEPIEASFAPRDTVRVEASTDRQAVIVGQQILLRILVIGEGPLPPGRLIPPRPEGADLLRLGGSDEGSKSWVQEHRYALFPRHAGRLEIPPALFSGWWPGTDGPQERRSDAIEIEVAPAPLSNASSWLPATAVSLSEAGPSMVRLAPGQVIERMLTLKAVGLRAEDLPPIQPSVPFQLQMHADAPRLWNQYGADGVTGYRSERITLGSAEPGLYELPGVTLAWWNVETADWERARLPAWHLQVAELDSASRRPTPAWQRAGSTDRREPSTGTAPTPSAIKQLWLLAHWPWLAGLLGALLLAGLAWRRSRRAR